jgi:hypothetical protein
VGSPRLDSPESIVDTLDHGASHVFDLENPVVAVVVILTIDQADVTDI